MSFEIGVCSWSLQVKNIPELEGLLERLGIGWTQIACGDPVHASWDEGDGFAQAAKGASFRITAAMLGFAGEDYTSPETIRRTGGFGDPPTRARRLETLEWGVNLTVELGLEILTTHAGFIPEPGEPDRRPFLDCLSRAAEIAGGKGLTLALETGQETADLLRRTIDELAAPNVKVNFDPANMLLYDKGDPIRAVEILGPDIVHVHLKDAFRPKVKGQWGEEVPLGKGEVNIPRYVETLRSVGYQGPLVIEREVGNQEQRMADVKSGIDLLRTCGGR